MKRQSSGVASCAYTSWATTSAGTSSASTSTAVNSGALACLFCRAATNRSGLALRAAATSERFVVSLSVPATNPAARSMPAAASTSGSSPSPTIASGSRSTAAAFGSTTVTS